MPIFTRFQEKPFWYGSYCALYKADVARKTGLSSQRIGVLTLESKAKLTAAELYLIAKAIGADPCEMLDYVCQDLK